jgi:hypothetical protein
MQTSECTKILNRLFVLFPSFQGWFEDLPHRRETWIEWERALSTADYVDCLEVLDGWTSGRAKPPAGFERDQTVYRLAREARDIQFDRIRKQQAEAVRNAATRREDYKPLPRFAGGMKAAYDKILTRLPEYKAGGMNWPEWQQWCEKCAKELVK